VSAEIKGLPFYMDRGEMVQLEGDVLGIVQQVRDISPRVKIYWNDQAEHFDFTEVSIDGQSERLIFSVRELDQRAVSRLRMSDQWRGREDPEHVLPDDEDFLSVIDHDDAVEEKERKDKTRDKLYDAGERLAWALGEDRRGVQAQISVPRSVDGSADDS
jgi:hypothetical protein